MRADELLQRLEDELSFSAIRASGPGGQNVNKVSSALQLRFDVGATRQLDDEVRERFIALAGNRMTRDGVLVMTARRHRTQSANRRDLMERLERLLHRALQVPKRRKRRGPSRAARARRLDQKRRQGERKQQRRRPRGEE